MDVGRPRPKVKHAGFCTDPKARQEFVKILFLADREPNVVHNHLDLHVASGHARRGRLPPELLVQGIEQL